MKKILTTLLFLVILMVLAGCGGKKTTEYRTNLLNVNDKMFENASVAEDILNQYSKVWKYSIESRSPVSVENMSIETGLERDVIEKYFEINNAGNVPNDFSSNIHSLNSYYESIGELPKIREVSTDVKNKITELNSPPDGYKEVYNEVLNLFDLTEEYIGMALDPSGSLQSFNDSRNQLTKDIISTNKRIGVIMPAEK